MGSCDQARKDAADAKKTGYLADSIRGVVRCEMLFLRNKAKLCLLGPRNCAAAPKENDSHHGRNYGCPISLPGKGTP